MYVLWSRRWFSFARRRDLAQPLAEFNLGALEIVLSLDAHPECGGRAEVSGEPERGVGRQRVPLVGQSFNPRAQERRQRVRPLGREIS